MNPRDHRIRHDDRDPNAQPNAYEAPDTARSEFTLLVAGCRGGKTSFLRLLLDTSDVSPTTTKDQLASVAKFVQGCACHTTHIRTASLDIEIADGPNTRRPLGLNLIDTPSFDFHDEQEAERLMADVLHHIDSRFVEGLEDEWKARSGDRYVHLCIYFLDPDEIVPPTALGPPAPVVPRARNGSFSQPEEPVILEPPVNNPYMLRPVLPKADIAAIRRLSGRVNVLPVIARADVLSNERLAAVKVAIRRDLAEAGIGFGIFDMDGQYQQPQEDRSESSNGYGGYPNGTSTSNGNSPPVSPVTPAALRLPYALISPDAYSHSDGVPRKVPSRHELMQQYAAQFAHASKLARGKFVRTYRWGILDVLDPTHSDFLSLRSAIFHHMETLQKYTKEYLFSKFRQEVQLQHQKRPPSHHSVSQMSMLPSNSRPILAIDTAPQAIHRQPPPLHHGEMHPTSSARPMQDSAVGSGSAKSSTKTNRQRTKKITVACNFCRSRKLKCDGGRPACGQCTKRNNPCDYMPQNKRRGTVSKTSQRPKGEESESDSGDEGRSPEPSVSPQVSSQTVSRRSSNVDKLHPDGYHPPNTLPPLNDRRDVYGSGVAGSSSVSVNGLSASVPLPGPPSGPSSRAKILHPPEPPQHNYYNEKNELPHIATLLPDASPSTPAPMSAPSLSLAPIRPASEQQAALRKRAATVPSKTTRLAGTSGPKVVACNFCRARKTKCDGAHPACASCARRQLACNYAHDSTASGLKKRRASTSKTTADSPESLSPPSSRMAPTPSIGTDMSREAGDHLDDELELKRPMDHSEFGRVTKKMRMDDSGVSIAQ
ncbi:fungal specific transcription factor domain-containing protein [Coprinopsis cinerea AmutBmut pab1-1]|nr:fungal specific transcription factor domain-containing protein [Coprinopsis cinerea AmutBmut pab1-1]